MTKTAGTVIEEKFYINDLKDEFTVDKFREEVFKELCKETNARINVTFEDDDLVVKLVMYGFVSTMRYVNMRERIINDYPLEEITTNVMKRFRAHVNSAFFKGKEE